MDEKIGVKFKGDCNSMNSQFNLLFYVIFKDFLIERS